MALPTVGSAHAPASASFTARGQHMRATVEAAGCYARESAPGDRVDRRITVAHLDHQPDHCDPSRPKNMCQRCQSRPRITRAPGRDTSRRKMLPKPIQVPCETAIGTRTPRRSGIRTGRGRWAALHRLKNQHRGGVTEIHHRTIGDMHGGSWGEDVVGSAPPGVKPVYSAWISPPVRPGFARFMNGCGHAGRAQRAA